MVALDSLADKYPGKVLNAPINEPLIMGTAAGAALHPGMRLIPEIQFADYSLNVLHWMVHLGHLHWATIGQVSPNVTVRMPCEPTLTGALYHSMSVESYFAHVPSVVMVMPSNSFDAYGLLRSAVDYEGLVVFLEPKDLYRVKHDRVVGRQAAFSAQDRVFPARFLHEGMESRRWRIFGFRSGKLGNCIREKIVPSSATGLQCSRRMLPPGNCRSRAFMSICSTSEAGTLRQGSRYPVGSEDRKALGCDRGPTQHEFRESNHPRCP